MNQRVVSCGRRVKALIDCRRLQPLSLPTEAVEGPVSLRQATSGGGLLSAELALMWRVLCTWLQVGTRVQSLVSTLWELEIRGGYVISARYSVQSMLQA